MEIDKEEYDLLKSCQIKLWDYKHAQDYFIKMTLSIENGHMDELIESIEALAHCLNVPVDIKAIQDSIYAM